KVLRALQENRITRVGGDKEIKVDVRVVAATNKDLKEEIRKGNFREDLYHRLAVILVHVPDLNQRREDVPLLIEHFTDIVCQEYGVPVKKYTREAIDELCNNNWSGNIRELRNVVERLIILSGKVIDKKDVFDYVIPASQRDHRFREIFEQFDNLEALNAYIAKEYAQYKSVD